MAESRRKMQALASVARQARKKSENLDIARCYASEVCEKLQSLPPSQKKAMFAAAGRRSAQLQAGNIALPRHVPGCWPAGVGKKQLRKLVAPRSKVEGDVYASEAFMWKLYKNARPQDVHPLDAQPSWRLARLLETRLPGWERIFKGRWSAVDLLAVSGDIADAAFLNVVHMYKHMLGERFPTGVFDWPPTEWLQSYRERKERVRDSKTHCDEPDRKRQRLVGTTGVEEETRAEAAGRPPKSADKTRAEAAGCQPKPARKTVADVLARDGRSSTASSSSSSTVLPGASTAPPAMLNIVDKWSMDTGVRL